MLLSANELRGYTLSATDGAIGRSKDLLFDDKRWVICYLVASTTRWLAGRKVLISPVSLQEGPDWVAGLLPVQLSKAQIEASPPIDPDEPISRRLEVDMHSLKEVTGYRIDARDGEVGHLEDFIVETDDWRLRYAVVDTRHWLTSKKVLVPVQRITSLSGVTPVVSVDMSRSEVEGCPEFDAAEPINRRTEERFYDYYGRAR